MRERRKRIDQEVERTLACFDDLETINPSPFFNTRLEAKLESHHKGKELFLIGIFNRVALRPVLIACLIILNVCSSVILFRGDGNQTESRKENLKAFASSYSLIQTEDETSRLLR